MSEQRIHLELGSRSYPIVIRRGLLARAGTEIAPFVGKNRRVIIVTDTQVAPLYLEPLQSALKQADITCEALTIPAGERSKSLSCFGELVENILAREPDRHTPLLALGGGVVGDITGFAASVVLRGIPFIQLPTSLLAQVDSSVGGKTGINSACGKNLIGSFYQPQLVLIDSDTLLTLPPRERKAGIAEVLKYGLIHDVPFYEWMERHARQMEAGDPDCMIEAIARSCQAKAAIVAADEREQGKRALLNFGHTFGHALEAETGFSEKLLHGEAVAMGMMMALRFSCAQGLCDAQTIARIAELYQILGLPQHPNDMQIETSAERLMPHFYHDKKAVAGTLTFILTYGIGQAFIAHTLPAQPLQDWLNIDLMGKEQ